MDKQSVRDLVAGYSIETTVREASRLETYQDLVPAGTSMYIPHVPGVAREDTVALAARLRREGMDPVPHIVARRTESAAILDDFLTRLVGEAGVTRVLVVAGDIDKPKASSRARSRFSSAGSSRSTASSISALPDIPKATSRFRKTPSAMRSYARTPTRRRPAPTSVLSRSSRLSPSR